MDLSVSETSIGSDLNGKRQYVRRIYLNVHMFRGNAEILLKVNKVVGLEVNFIISSTRVQYKVGSRDEMQ